MFVRWSQTFREFLLMALLLAMLVAGKERTGSADALQKSNSNDEMKDADGASFHHQRKHHQRQNRNVTPAASAAGKHSAAVGNKQKMLRTGTASSSPSRWPFRDQAARIEGDIIIGGLMMVHERDEAQICGKVMPQGGMQATEAMLYTLDVINNSTTLSLPGIRLGALIKDDCDRDIYGLEQSVNFIQGYVSRWAKGSECSDGTNSSLVAGVVGASSSVTSIQVANLLKLFKIPQVSFFSTSSELSSDQRYPFFLRTIPSDKNQAEAMVAMVKKLGWTYVSIVYEESSYGEKGYDEVQQRLRNDNICIAVTEKLPKDSGVAVATAYDKVVANLNLLPANGRGVIVFASDQEVSEMMRAVRRANLTGNFMWIGSDGWGGRRLVSDTNEAEVEGAITFQPYAEPFTEFENYFLSLTPDNNPRNPWFVEYWEDYFKCRVAGSPTTPFNGHYKPCTRHERQNRTNGYVPEAQLQFVSNAVMAFAFALKNLHRDFCGSDYKGICDNWVETNRSGDLLLQYLLNVTFEGLVGGSFKFLPNGDAPAKYRVLNFKRVSAKEYNWVAVGTYNEGNLAINEAELQFKWNMRKHNMSYCNKKCDMNQATSYLKGNKCCWNCITCSTYEYLTENRDQCRECSPGTKPNENRTICVDIPVEYLTFNSGLSIVAITVASCGLIVTSFIIAVFVRYCSTPVVRAAGRELTFVLLVGILGCYSMTFIILSPPNVITCGAQRFGIGFWFSICYAALLTKTNRIARIFRAGRRTIKRPNFISPTSQLLICGAFVTFQVFIGVAWMLWQPPRAISYYPTREENILICDSGLGSGSMIGLFYPIILIGVCTVYAVQTRKIPEAFNESKYIGFTMYTTSIIWLAFVAIFFGTANNVKIRLATLCFTISLSASVVLACLFTPKLYIILIRPDRNVRQSMMAGKLAATAAKVKANSSTSSPRLDSGNLSDGEMELHQRLKRSPSVSSSISRNTIGTQTQQQGGSNISTQTLDVPSHRIVYDYLMDVQL